MTAEWLGYGWVDELAAMDAAPRSAALLEELVSHGGSRMLAQQQQHEISGPELHRAVAEQMEHSTPWQHNDSYRDMEAVPDPLVDTLRRMEELLPEGDVYAHGNAPTFAWLGPNTCGLCEDRSPVRLVPDAHGVLMCPRCAPEREPAEPASIAWERHPDDPAPRMVAHEDLLPDWMMQHRLYVRHVDPGPERPLADLRMDTAGGMHPLTRAGVMAMLAVQFAVDLSPMTAAMLRIGEVANHLAGTLGAYRGDFTLHGTLHPVPRTRAAHLSGARRRRHRRR